MLKNLHKVKRRTGPAGSYSRDQFGRALAPLWIALEFSPERREDVARAALICTRMYNDLGAVLPLEEVYDTADQLAELVSSGAAFPDITEFLPKHRREAVARYNARRGPTTKEGLRQLGYPTRSPRRPR